ncbi:MAG TPA: hypothetical protein VII78_08270 [Myxococcota bacterium]
MRSLLVGLGLALALATPALAQTTPPPPETIDFEGRGTPIVYKPGAKVPKAARLKSLSLSGGGSLKFRTRGGADYVALVTHLGTTAIVGVSNNGKIEALRDIDIQLRKAKHARLDAFTPLQAGERVDGKGTTDPADDEKFYDNPGFAEFQLYDSRQRLFPIDGSRFVSFRSVVAPGPYKDSFDLTTTSLDFTRLITAGTMVYDDLVVSYGH